MSNFATADSATKHAQGDAITPEVISKQLSESGHQATAAVARYATMLGDDALMLGQRLSWWVSRAPEMEEDIALGNIALDLIGHARFFLTYAGSADGRTEDDLAYFRPEEEFLSLTLVEQENGDFGQTIARQLIVSYYQLGLYTRLVDSQDPVLSAIASKALKEVYYHADHATQWVLRLGLGTEESHRRMQAGLNLMWPYLDEVFEDLDVHRELAEQGIAVLPSTLRQEFEDRIHATLEKSTLRVPDIKQARSGQRSGRYSEFRGYILAEMQSLARQHPGATW